MTVRHPGGGHLVFRRASGLQGFLACLMAEEEMDYQMRGECQANEAIAAAGLAEKVSVRLQDVATLPLHEATVIYMYARCLAIDH